MKTIESIFAVLVLTSAWLPAAEAAEEYTFPEKCEEPGHRDSTCYRLPQLTASAALRGDVNCRFYYQDYYAKGGGQSETFGVADGYYATVEARPVNASAGCTEVKVTGGNSGTGSVTVRTYGKTDCKIRVHVCAPVKRMASCRNQTCNKASCTPTTRYYTDYEESDIPTYKCQQIPSLCATKVYSCSYTDQDCDGAQDSDEPTGTCEQTGTIPWDDPSTY